MEVKLPVRSRQGLDPVHRTSLSTSSNIIVACEGHLPNLHSAERRSEKRLASRIRKGGELTRRRSHAPVPAPVFVSEGIYFFIPTHPLEVRWSWDWRRRHTVRLEQFVDTVTSRPLSSRLATSTVPMQGTRGENTADKESGGSQRTLQGFQTNHRPS